MHVPGCARKICAYVCVCVCVCIRGHKYKYIYIYAKHVVNNTINCRWLFHGVMGEHGSDNAAAVHTYQASLYIYIYTYVL